MSDNTTISDDEIILRHIPGGTAWQAPGPRVSSFNFKVRTLRGETGISVTRASMTTARELLAHVQTTAGSKVAAARVGDLRALGLHIVPMPLDHDPGHSEIQSGSADLADAVLRKRVARLFRFVDDLPESTA